MNDLKAKFQEIYAKAIAGSDKLKRYSFLLFVVFVGLIYGYLIFQINSLNTQKPTDEAIAKQVKAAKIPQIDKEVVKQLESLEDNSVNVQTLFNQARSNPFQ